MLRSHTDSPGPLIGSARRSPIRNPGLCASHRRTKLVSRAESKNFKVNFEQMLLLAHTILPPPNFRHLPLSLQFLHSYQTPPKMQLVLQDDFWLHENKRLSRYLFLQQRAKNYFCETKNSV